VFFSFRLFPKESPLDSIQLSAFSLNVQYKLIVFSFTVSVLLMPYRREQNSLRTGCLEIEPGVSGKDNLKALSVEEL
jgi:hypothetical protein